MIPMVVDSKIEFAHTRGQHKERPVFGCEGCRARRGELYTEAEALIAAGQKQISLACEALGEITEEMFLRQYRDKGMRLVDDANEALEQIEWPDAP